MKKTFELTHPKIKTPRLVDRIKFDVKKYFKRERKKALPEGVDFWDFDCRFGQNAEEAKPVATADVFSSIDIAEKKGYESFYLEILAKPGHRS
ncbi:MAG: hypothetical protein HQK83_14765 [Fibrobacteria bacterium]|nr:hypothetical protein [Fibrobacteria bacterium]